MIYSFEEIKNFYFFDILFQIFLPIYCSGSRYFPLIKLCEGNYIILEIVMVICKFNQAQRKPLGRGDGKEWLDWSDEQNKVCGHLTTKCLSTASQAWLSMEAWGYFNPQE